jgi:hypothetical protein
MHRMKDLTRGICHNNDPEEALKHFIHFAISTLGAPTSAALQ